jgi:methylated-DNA-[protein]-cysteine S-methyltransferase
MSLSVWYTTMPSPFGPLCLAANAQGLIRVDFQQGERPILPEANWQEGGGPITDAKQQLEEYFQGQRQDFHVLLAPQGTPFQQRVWQELQRIPYGSTITYLELAQRLGNPRAVRAVGHANARNPIAIMIPCHRVIGRDGRLHGYASGLDFKRRLLLHEGAPLRQCVLHDGSTFCRLGGSQVDEGV